MDIDIGIRMPLNAATKTFAILAKKGAGKTYTGAVMAEELYKAKIPFVVLDPIDVWWGLRLSADGKSPGLPVVIFGGDHADLPLDRDMGRRIAQEIVKKNVSCVISTFGMPKVAQRHLIAEFCDELLRLNNTPRHVFIEEAHEFLPQRVMAGTGVCFNAVSNIVVMGGNRRIGVSLLNQRAATLNKDVLTQADTLIALRSVGPQDRKAIEEWVNYHAAEGDLGQFVESLPKLPNGTAWVWSPEFLNIFEKVQIRKRETYHPDRDKAAPELDFSSVIEVDINDFIAGFPAGKGTQKGVAYKFGDSSHPTRMEFNAAPTQAQTALVDEQMLQQLKNDYESKLVQKDIELRQARDMIEKARAALGGQQPLAQMTASGGQIQMWIEKLGAGHPSKILRFLAEKRGLKFTTSQIALGTGISPRSSSFEGAMSLLKKNRLVVGEGGLYTISPDL